jgi:hypothetical protein
VATGYYALYYDEAGHADFSHEWDPMRMIPMESAPWICVVRPLLLVETEIIVMNSCFGVSGEAGASRWSARLRDGQGRVLAETPMPDIPPRGSARVGLSQVFPNVRELASSAATLAFEATGCNIMGPFSFVRSASGDFNIHHFC